MIFIETVNNTRFNKKTNILTCSRLCQSLGTDAPLFVGIPSVPEDRHLQYSFNRCQTF